MSTTSAATKATFLLQNVPKLSAETAFAHLKTHLTRATVTFDYEFREYTEEELKLREDEPERIDSQEPFQALIFEEKAP